MRILVTGGAGFIASHIADRYVQMGHEVAIVDDLSAGRRQNINRHALFHEIPIQSRELTAVFEQFRPEIISHHAAHIDLRRSVEDPLHDAETNILGTLNLLSTAQNFHCKKIIFASTGGAIYGEPEELPVDETRVPKPLSPYGINKLAAEHYLRIWKTLYGMEYTIFRYPNVYGPRQDPEGEAGVVAIFASKMLGNEKPVIFGDGSKTRDYLYVSDVVDANVLALQCGSGNILTLGWGKEISDYDVFSNVRRAVGCDIEPDFAEVRKGEVYRIALNADRAEKRLAWTPKVPFDLGTRKTVDFFRQKFER